MKTLKLTISVVCILFLSVSAYSQNKTVEKIEDAKETVEKTNEAVKEVGKLFKSVFGKKKKNKQEKDASKKSKPLGSNSEKTIAVSEEKKLAKNPNQLKAGSIHPDAVVLNVDKLYPFNKGAALVQKGSSTALINARGEFIVPFNQYDFLVERGDDFRSHSGIFKAITKNGESGLVNAEGKFFKIPHQFKLGRISGKYLKLETKGKLDRTVANFMDFYGKLYTITELPKYVPTNPYSISKEGLVPYQNGSTYKWGYKNINNKIITNALYDEAYPFSDAVALVGKKNEFGEIKYGYITTSGKLLIPLKFSKKPGFFSNGLAKVYYNKGDKKYAIINKKGEIIFSGNQNIRGPFYNGYASMMNKNVLDTNGNIISVKQLLMKYGVPVEISNNASVILPETFVYYAANKILRNRSSKIPFRFGGEKHNICGFIDVVTGKSFYGNFYLDHMTDFDATAKRALVKYKSPEKEFEGYINENGIFMIVKGEASKW